jgi:cytoskeletal protein CcmA (bactofilin family)
MGRYTMATFGFLKKNGDKTIPDSKNVESSIPLVDSTPNTIYVPPIQKEDSKMLKFGDHNEKDAVSENTGNGNGRSTTGAGTLIGEHITIEGIIRADEDIVIEGTVKGSVEAKSHQLTVGTKGKVEADIKAESVIISGRMVGNIIAHGKVQIMKSADFSGQIKAKRIAVEDGAYIKATIELERDSNDHPPLQKPIEATVYTSSDIKDMKTEIVKPQSVK